MKRKGKKKFWLVFQAERQSCYCAFCGSLRKIYVDSSLPWFLLAGCFLLFICLMLAIGVEAGWKAVAIMSFVLLLAELWIRLRWRISIVCYKCGFDPVLYKKRPELAAERVRKYLEDSKKDAFFLLASRPKLPFRVEKKKPIEPPPRHVLE